MELPIFYQPWYLDVTCRGGAWDIALSFNSSNEPDGIWPYFIKKKYGISYVTLPPLTPFLGPLAFTISKERLSSHKRRKVHKRVLFDLTEQLPQTTLWVCQSLPDFSNWQPLYWKGFTQTTRYTHRIDLSSTKEELLNNISAKTRQRIKKAESSVEISESSEILTISHVVNQSFARQDVRNPIRKDLLLDLDQELKKKNQKVALIAKSKGSTVAATYFIYDREVAYLILTGRTDDDPGGTVSLLIWRSILEAKRLGLKWFDFEGSMIEGIADFFSSFGGELTPYHRLVRTPNKFIHSMLKASGKI